ncbi:unnamed protein product [Peronospora belbahrii]|uniref:Uncharacterized protein n=1 Tax=Peronospora belbahrii TaxID=622444 RepID=A0ABN8CVP1_9STRA|nr:unnamed protein product [Peronospora belbahrii]
MHVQGHLFVRNEDANKIRRYLETLTTQLNIEVQELQARRHYALEQLEGLSNQSRCNCEREEILLPPTQPTAEPKAESQFLRNASWQLKPTESKGSETKVRGDKEASIHHHTSFLSSTFFVLVVFFMAIPVACVIGFVLFCKRRRRPQHTHA